MRDRRAPNVPPLSRCLLAVLSGVLLTLSFPGGGSQAWLAFVALVPLLVAIDGVGPRAGAALGFASGFALWTVTFAWPAPWVVRYGGVTWARAGLTVLVLATILSAFIALFCLLLAATGPRSGMTSVVIIASLWVALELIRSRVLSGFPWNLLGASQYQRHALIQVATVTGVYGVSFVVVAVNAAVARLVARARDVRDAFSAAAVAATAAAAALAVGWLAPARPADTTPIPVAIVQGDIDQATKWNEAYADQALAIHRALTLEAVRNGARLVVWPETTVPLPDRRDPRWHEVEQLAREHGIYLLVGSPYDVGTTTRNSAFLIGPSGELGRYDKRRLVPFGEYSPLAGKLGFLSVYVTGSVGDFSAGADTVVFATPFARLAPSICYEAIFPAGVRDFVLAGAEVLVNITNDAWFGPSPAPFQHLALATFRAVEHRAWLVRAANSGISAFVAPDGRIVHAAPLFARGVLMGSITPRTQTTLYTRFGDVFAWSTLGLAAGVLCPLPQRRRRGRIAEAPTTG